MTILKGNATTTPFIIACSGWKDEGSRPTRNLNEDSKTVEPLIYEYISHTRRTFSFGTVEIIMPLFKGGKLLKTNIFTCIL